ncbi:hypothetical protein, partial [Massilia horti]|uniref:hypothetical protein n=1 Tax=Massilia horti TaxID=2562153 RepID=UPI00197E041F
DRPKRGYAPARERLAAAQLALDHGDGAGARHHLKRLLYLEPDSILGHYLSGIAHMATGSRTRARRQFGVSAVLLDGLADDAPVPGADGWQAGALRALVATWMERAA